MSLGVLIVGLGAIGMSYDLHLDTDQILSHARAISLHSFFHLLGGVDSDIEKRTLFEQYYGCNAFSNLEAALSVTKPEVVIIAVPTEHHADVLFRTLEQCSPKVILCEKPLSYDLDAAQRMVNQCNQRQIKLYVNYMRRSDPSSIEIKRRFDVGEIGSPVKGVVWYSKGLLHNGSHFFNLLEYWLDGLVSTQVIDYGRMWQEFDFEPDFTVMFNRGQVFFLAKREEDYSHYTVELIASNGRLRYESAGRDIFWQPVIQNTHFSSYRSISVDVERIESKMNCFQYNVMEQIALALEEKKNHLSTGDDALRTLRTLKNL